MQVRQHREILLDVDSTDDPTYGQQQLSFFNGAYKAAEHRRAREGSSGKRNHNECHPLYSFGVVCSHTAGYFGGLPSVA